MSSTSHNTWLTKVLQLKSLVNQVFYAIFVEGVLMNRIKSMRLSRGLTQEALVERMGGLISKQALSKYETEKATPSPSVAIRLAQALGVKTISLFTPPQFKIEFIAYRRASTLGILNKKAIEGLLSEEIIHRLQLQERLGVNTGFLDDRIKISSIEEAETAARTIRQMWNLGTNPIANLTDILERRSVHVLPVDQAPEKFHGISAFALNCNSEIVGAGVAYKNGTVGERQRMTLAHELGHLVMEIHESCDEEKAAFRFAGSLLMPEDDLLNTLGRSRSHLTKEELVLLKEYFGVSMQAIIYRAKDLGIIGESLYRECFQAFNKLGWRKQEPRPLPSEEPKLWQQLLQRAVSEKQLTYDEAKYWNLDEAETTEKNFIDPRIFRSLPKDERNMLLQKQANSVKNLYQPGSDFIEWTEDYIDDLEAIDG